MTTRQKPNKLTVTIDDPELVEIIREITADRHIPASQVVTSILRRGWQAMEDDADLEAAREASGEPTIPWEQFEEQLRAAEATQADNSAA